jgi:hypothetical protein
MNFEQFDVEFRRVLEAVESGAADAELSVEIERLRGLAGQIADPADRKDAGHDIEMIEDILATPPSEPVSAVMQAARRAYAEAVRYDGTPEERIERVQHGIDELDLLAGQADEEDRASIYGLNESLYLLISGLRTEL